MPLDFPSSPTNGQVYGNYYYNSARGAWNALLPAATPNFFTNAQLIDSTATSSLIATTPLTVKGLSGQTASLQEWKDSAGTVLSSISASGQGYFSGASENVLNLTQGAGATAVHIYSNGDGYVGWIARRANGSRRFAFEANPTGSNGANFALYFYDSTGANPKLSWSSSYNSTFNTINQIIDPRATTDVALRVRGLASQTADLQQWQSSTGAVLSDINSKGELQVPRIGVGSVMPTTTHLYVTAAAASNIPIVVQGAASQSAALQAWANSAGSTLAYVGTSGEIVSTNSVIGVTPNDLGSTGGLISRAPAGGSQTSAYLQFVNNANTAQWGAIEATSASDMNISTNNLTISGRLKVTNQPAFSIQGNGAQVMSGSAVVVKLNYSVSTTLINNGNHYSTTNHRFTAPAPGMYYFHATACVTSNIGGPELLLYKNGAQYVDYLAIGYGAAYNTFGNSAILQLATNDYVEIYMRNNNSTSFGIDLARSYFSGMKIG